MIPSLPLPRINLGATFLARLKASHYNCYKISTQIDIALHGYLLSFAGYKPHTLH